MTNHNLEIKILKKFQKTIKIQTKKQIMYINSNLKDGNNLRDFTDNDFFNY